MVCVSLESTAFGLISVFVKNLSILKHLETPVWGWGGSSLVGNVSRASSQQDTQVTTQPSFLPREFTADFLPPWWPVVGFFTTSRVLLQVAEGGCLRALFFCLVPSFVILDLERLFPYSRTTALQWNVQRRLVCNKSKVTRHLGLFSLPLLKFFYSFILYWKKVKVLVAQSSPTLCDPVDCM